MKTIEVVAAILRDGDKIFATQRGYGEFKGKWEFPGGKIEQNETHENALIREIKEELDVSIVVNKFLKTVEYNYESFYLIMHCYLCEGDFSTLSLNEHESAKWLGQNELLDVDWLPADIEILNDVKKEMNW